MDEQQYLDLMRNVCDRGFKKTSRTGINTRSLIGAQMRFALTRDEEPILPLLTTKRTSFKLIASELLWFISGKTNIAPLQEQNNHIWDANASREYLDSRGLSYPEGELGPVYGAQWRNFNGNGIDQLARAIYDIRNSPDSRRIIVCAWNPAQNDQMALPPCHVMFQFIVQGDTLSCILTQRSADIPLGVPFNIASYALLTHMIAQICDLRAGELVHNIGDAHIYENQLDSCAIQLERDPREFPRINITKKDNIDDYCMSDFTLLDYNPHPVIKFPFAV